MTPVFRHTVRGRRPGLAAITLSPLTWILFVSGCTGEPERMAGTIEVERPEILVYERTEAGEYELVGVEYAVPFDAWSDPDPPTVMGQELKASSGLGLWYLHVWVWRPNPNGLFADWNPTVACRP
jgi:hypothetical protein